MRILYVADNGFSFEDGTFYYTRPNDINAKQYQKYFDKIIYIARTSKHMPSDIAIDEKSKVILLGRYDFLCLYKRMKKHKDEYDAVVVRNGLYGCFAAFYAKLLGKLLISYCGADPLEFQEAKGTLTAKVIGFFWQYLENIKMKKADYAHYCTKVLYDRYPCDNPYLICSNVNIKIEDSVLQKRLNKISHSTGSYKLGLLGQLGNDDRKGISTVIRALQILGNNYSFEIVGGGNPDIFLSLACSLGVENRVHFLGYLSDTNEINKWLDTVDIYVQPSLAEGLPRATIEAMARACPAMGTKVCGMIELLDDRYLIACRDYKNMAYIIKRMSNIEELKETATRNFEKSKDYTSEVRDRKLNIFYNSIVDDFKNRIKA